MEPDATDLGIKGGGLALPAAVMTGVAILLFLGPNPHGDAGYGWAFMAAALAPLAAGLMLLLLMGFCAYALLRRDLKRFLLILAWNTTAFTVYVVANFFVVSLISGSRDPQPLWPFPAIFAGCVAQLLIVLSIRYSVRSRRVARRRLETDAAAEAASPAEV
jgi:hypothetical protein